MTQSVTSQEPKPTFEQSIKELESLVERMEQGELSLEESLQAFERGVEISRVCQQVLDEAEQRVRVLTKDTDLA